MNATNLRTQRASAVGVCQIELPNTFNLTVDNTPFTEDETPLLTHLTISREALTKEANALYEKRERERERAMKTWKKKL